MLCQLCIGEKERYLSITLVGLHPDSGLIYTYVWYHTKQQHERTSSGAFKKKSHLYSFKTIYIIYIYIYIYISCTLVKLYAYIHTYIRVSSCGLGLEFSNEKFACARRGGTYVVLGGYGYRCTVQTSACIIINDTLEL